MSNQAKALTRNEVVAIGWNGDAEILDLNTGKSYMIRGSVSTGYDHSDYQTKTTNDTAIKKQCAGGNWNWDARPVILKLKGHLIAAATHTYPHSIPVASNADNIVSPVRTRANEKDSKGNWNLGSHFCLHYIDSIKMRNAKIGDGSWTDKMYKAVQEALTLYNKTVTTPATPSTPAPTTANDTTIWNFLKGKGLNDFAVAGIMGNLYAESALNPKNLQNTYEKSLCMTDDEYTKAVDSGAYKNFVKDSAGYGLAQWTYYTRKQALLDFAKAANASIGDLMTQLNFLWKELQGYTGVMKTLKTACSILEASNAVLTDFERPADQSATAKTKRAGYGQTYYDKFASKTSTPSAPSTPAKKSIDELAKEVINGKWGNGQERKDKLTAAGYNYSEVQARVNALLK